MKTIKKIVVIAALLFTGLGSSEATAQECGDYTQSSSSSSPSSFTILDTDIGTAAYQRLLPFSSGGHRALGMAIAAKFNYFDNCEYVGIGIGDGSGGNGYRPNYTISMWRDGVDVDIAQAAIYELVGASADPVVTNGDCNISCDGTTGRQFDGTIATTTTTTPETTTTTTTTLQPVVAPVSSWEPVEEVAIVPVEEPVIIETTTTTTVLVSVQVIKSVSTEVITVKETLKNKSKPKRAVVYRRKLVSKERPWTR
jgi:hypothetical protein